MWSLGHEPVGAVDGVEAVAQFERGRPDLVITDLVMPVMNGWRLLQQIRMIDPCAPIIVVSGGATKADVERARKEAVPLLHKPVRLAELETVVRRVTNT